MSKTMHKIKVGNQTGKILTVVPNHLEPKPITPHRYVEWDSYPVAVDVQVQGENRTGQVIYLGTFSYSNLSHNYADLHVFESALKRETTEFLTLYYYLEGETDPEGETIHPFAFVDKAMWESLRSE